jgi:type IV pilus biogenesis protein CpaD/CtpE
MDKLNPNIILRAVNREIRNSNHTITTEIILPCDKELSGSQQRRLLVFLSEYARLD